MDQDKSTKKVRATGAQIAAARVYLRMTQEDLAALAGVAPATLVTVESEMRRPYASTKDKIQAALEAKGIVFTNGKKPGFYFDTEAVQASEAAQQDA